MTVSKRYKLLGAFWDRQPSNLVKLPNFYTEDEMGYCEDYDIEYNLFDTVCMQRKIKFSEILKLINYSDFEAIMNQVVDCNRLFIQIDYLPTNFVPIVARFVTTRLIQVYLLVIKYNKQAEVGIMAMDDVRSKIIPYMMEHIILNEKNSTQIEG